ncbi:S1 family peptidase [Pyxidicoccus sp. 3LFB2]
MQREFGLSAEQAKARMAFEAAVPSIEKSLKAELSDRFGGAWLNKEGNKLIVGVTNEADAALVRSAGAEPKLVKYTSEQLEKIKADLDGQAQFAGSDIHAWYVDPVTNSVVVEVAETNASLSGVSAFVASVGKDSDAVRVVPSKERPQPLYNIVGGNAYYIGGGRCSVGFAVTAGGFVTAGHCGRTGATTTGYNRVAQGTFRGSSFPGNDYAWVKTNTNWTPTNQVAGTSSRVAGSTVAAIGASVCRSGSTTGWRCGTMGAYNATVNYPQGSVSGLTRTSVCAEPGDSGGSFISGTQAQGVTSGGSGNCSSGGTTYFQPVNEILSVYGLTLQR